MILSRVTCFGRLGCQDAVGVAKSVNWTSFLVASAQSESSVVEKAMGRVELGTSCGVALPLTCHRVQRQTRPDTTDAIMAGRGSSVLAANMTKTTTLCSCHLNFFASVS